MRLVAITILGLLVAGCSEAPVDTAAAPEPPGVAAGSDEPIPEIPGATLGPLAAPDENVSLDAPPVLVPGEWWQIRFTSPLTGATADFVRVVAEAGPDGYVIGMPHEAWYKEAMVYQMPALGEIFPNLSANVNGQLFLPIRFPVLDGDTWTTSFGSFGQVTARVEVTGDTTANVTFTAPGGFFGVQDPTGITGPPEFTVVTATYDAAQHEVVNFSSPSASFEVVNHGFGYEGWVTIPRGQQLAFFVGRFAGVTDIPGAPAAPTETIEIAGGFNRLTFVLAASALSPGAYRETATAPDGSSYEYAAVPHAGGFGSAFFEQADPDGTWSFEHVAVGAGVAFAKGVAYHQYDIELPGGATRGDHSHSVDR